MPRRFDPPTRSTFGTVTVPGNRAGAIVSAVLGSGISAGAVVCALSGSRISASAVVCAASELASTRLVSGISAGAVVSAFWVSGIFAGVEARLSVDQISAADSNALAAVRAEPLRATIGSLI